MKVKSVILKVVLAIIIFMILMIPIFIFLNMENKDKDYEKLIDDIKSSAEKYVAHNDIGDASKIKISVLKKANLLENALVNPKTKKPLSNETYVSLTNNGTVNEVVLYDIPSEDNVAELIVTFNGDKHMQNGISVRYEELGVNIFDGTTELSYSTQYFVKGKEVTSIDVYKPRDYEVVYTALSSKGELAKVVRTVIVQ